MASIQPRATTIGLIAASVGFLISCSVATEAIVQGPKGANPEAARYAQDQMRLPPGSCGSDAPPDNAPKFSARVWTDGDDLRFELSNAGASTACIWSPFGQPLFPSTIMMVRVIDPAGAEIWRFNTTTPVSQGYSSDEIRRLLVHLEPGRTLSGAYPRLFRSYVAFGPGRELDEDKDYQLVLQLSVTYQARLPQADATDISRGLKTVWVSTSESCHWRRIGGTVVTSCS